MQYGIAQLIIIINAQINRASKSGPEEKRLIVVLEGAHLETVKFGKGFGILNVDEHAGILRKSGRDFTSARPDITHQVHSYRIYFIIIVFVQCK